MNSLKTVKVIPAGAWQACIYPGAFFEGEGIKIREHFLLVRIKFD